MEQIHTKSDKRHKISSDKKYQFILHSDDEGAVLIYGRGGELGDFNVFVQSLINQDLKAKYDKNIAVKHIERKKDLIDYLSETDFGFKISELHIFSHSFGTGLSLAYEDPALEKEREAWVQNSISQYYDNNKLDDLYDAIIAREISILFIDDLLYLMPEGTKNKIQNKFDAKGAFVKIWGCNSGYENWTYSTESIYWGALNYKHNPKPSMARAFAILCNVNTYGATSGSHIEVKDNGQWIKSDEYERKHGSPPSGALPSRLKPDRGDYIEFKPQ
jgi:hypothetical protein